ncbi:MAG: OmpA family protein [Candidatus Zixiibacteriota bacterium]
MPKIQTYLLSIIFIVGFIFADTVAANTARKNGIGFGYSSNPNPADAVLVNPAGVSEDDFHLFYAGYSKLFTGISDDIFNTYAIYTSPRILGFGLGASFSQLGSDAYAWSNFNIAINYDFRFDRNLNLKFGLSPHIYRIAYSEYDPTDRLFIEKGDNKFSFGLDGGIILQYRDFSLGGNIHNIVKPNIALDDNTDAGILGQEIQAGVSYHFSQIGIEPFLGFSYEEDDPAQKLHPSFGIQGSLFSGFLTLRASLSDNDFSLSIGLNPSLGAQPMEFDYCFDYPTGDFKNASLVNHHFGIGYRLRKKEKTIIYPDLTLEPAEDFEKLYSSGRKVELDILYTRDNIKVDDSIDVSLEVKGPENPTINKKILLDQLDTSTVHYEFTLKEIGKYNIIIKIDPDSLIDEKNENNNAMIASIVVSGDLIADIEPDNNVLEIEKLTFISEEEPFVPIIFFDENSSKIPKRFNKTLDVLARRLKRNPDVQLELNGYIDSSTDTSLSIATQRSINVKAYLISKGVAGQSIKIAPVTDYDITKARIIPRSKNLSEKEKDWIHDENRRVELNPSLKGERELYESWDPTAYTDGISGFMKTHSNLICNNPDITIQFEWTTASNIVGRYDQISQFRNLIETMIEGECGREYNIPIIVKEGDEGNVALSLSSEKIIYSPIQHAQTAANFEIPDSKQNNKIKVDISDPEVIVEHHLVIMDALSGDTLKNLSSGHGPPPKAVNWDWRDDNGVLLDPTGRYLVDLAVQDVLNKDFQFKSDTMKIIPTESMERNTSSIIIQFVFDEIASTSHFLESRIDHFAQWIVRIAGSEEIESADIRVIGHTDPIGKPERNAELSKMRSEKEYNALIEHLKAILELQEKDDVENWLQEKNIKLISEGVSAESPYMINRPIGRNQSEKVLLGDNKYPEGRSINRRVVIEVEEKFKGGVEAPAATVPMK